MQRRQGACYPRWFEVLSKDTPEYYLIIMLESNTLRESRTRALDVTIVGDLSRTILPGLHSL